MNWSKNLGVSRPTVAKALQQLERQGLIVRRAGAGTFVQKSDAATKRFGLLIPGLGSTEIFGPICTAMARSAQENGFSLIWGASIPSPSDADDRGRMAMELASQYVRDKVSGVFFAPLELAANKDKVNSTIINQFENARIAVVLLDRDFAAYPKRSEYDLVGIDNRRAGFMITQHLFDLGCRKPVFVAKPNSAETIEARIAGFAEAYLRNGAQVHPDNVVRWRPGDNELLAEKIANLNPDSYVCGNDVTAAELLKSLDELGVSVPDHAKVTGIDDVKYAELLRVPLTTIRQPCVAIGQAAFQTMLNRIANPDAPAMEVLLGCELIARQSTR